MASDAEQLRTENQELSTASETTLVTMCELSDNEISDYVATGEPMDKAGAYAIQGIASRWIPRIEGDYSNVVALPVALVYAMLREARSCLSERARLGRVDHKDEAGKRKRSERKTDLGLLFFFFLFFLVRLRVLSSRP